MSAGPAGQFSFIIGEWMDGVYLSSDHARPHIKGVALASWYPALIKAHEFFDAFQQFFSIEPLADCNTG